MSSKDQILSIARTDHKEISAFRNRLQSALLWRLQSFSRCISWCISFLFWQLIFIVERWNSKNSVCLCQKCYLFWMMEVWSPKFCLLWEQKVPLRIKLSCVNCRAFHAASYGMFCLSIWCIKEEKNSMWTYNEQEWWPNESYRKFITIVLCEVWSNSIER